MSNQQRGVAEIIIAVLMMAVLVKMLVATKRPKSYTCKPQQFSDYLVCEYQY